MSGSIYMATSGAIYCEQRLDILSNNLANVNTSGFKEEKPYFRVTEPPPEVAEGREILGRLWVRGEYLAWAPKGVDVPALG